MYIQNNMEVEIVTLNLERFPGHRIILDCAKLKSVHAISHLQV